MDTRILIQYKKLLFFLALVCSADIFPQYVSPKKFITNGEYTALLERIRSSELTFNTDIARECHDHELLNQKTYTQLATINAEEPAISTLKQQAEELYNFVELDKSKGKKDSLDALDAIYSRLDYYLRFGELVPSIITEIDRNIQEAKKFYTECRDNIKAFSASITITKKILQQSDPTFSLDELKKIDLLPKQEVQFIFVRENMERAQAILAKEPKNYHERAKALLRQPKKDILDAFINLLKGLKDAEKMYNDYINKIAQREEIEAQFARHLDEKFLERRQLERINRFLAQRHAEFIEKNSHQNSPQELDKESAATATQLYNLMQNNPREGLSLLKKTYQEYFELFDKEEHLQIMWADIDASIREHLAQHADLTKKNEELFCCNTSLIESMPYYQPALRAFMGTLNKNNGSGTTLAMPKNKEPNSSYQRHPTAQHCSRELLRAPEKAFVNTVVLMLKLTEQSRRNIEIRSVLVETLQTRQKDLSQKLAAITITHNKFIAVHKFLTDHKILHREVQYCKQVMKKLAESEPSPQQQVNVTAEQLKITELATPEQKAEDFLKKSTPTTITQKLATLYQERGELDQLQQRSKFLSKKIDALKRDILKYTTSNKELTLTNKFLAQCLMQHYGLPFDQFMEMVNEELREFNKNDQPPMMTSSHFDENIPTTDFSKPAEMLVKLNLPREKLVEQITKIFATIKENKTTVEKAGIEIATLEITKKQQEAELKKVLDNHYKLGRAYSFFADQQSRFALEDSSNKQTQKVAAKHLSHADQKYVTIPVVAMKETCASLSKQLAIHENLD